MRMTAAIISIRFLLAGCAHVFGEESLALVASVINFREVKLNPDAFAGRYVLLGGALPE